jgi:hypothetical protein
MNVGLVLKLSSRNWWFWIWVFETYLAWIHFWNQVEPKLTSFIKILELVKINSLF